MNSEIMEKVEYELFGLEPMDKLEIIANLLIKIGYNTMDAGTPLGGRVDPKAVVDTIIQDLEDNGETLANAIARQGLVMLQWLERKED